MGIKSNRHAVSGVAAAAVLALALSACGAANEEGGSDGELTGVLKGAGASSQEKAQEAWIAKIQGLNAGFEVQYQPVGSTDGRAQFVNGGVAYAGTDSALNDEEGQLTEATERCGSEPIQIPAYVSPIAVAFNLEGVETVNLSADTIAQIFDNKITTWDDPAIAADNDGVDLPGTEITPVHRSDGSGTTENFTDYLSAAAPDAWPYPAEDIFPVKGEAAEGTSGVVQQINTIDGAIGYADASQVEGLGLVSVKVGESFQGPTPEGAAAVLEASPSAGASDVDMAVELDRTTTTEGAYPIVLLSYLLACQSYDDAETEANVKGFLEYVISAEGQEASAEEAGSAPLGEATTERAEEIISGIGE